ncbi:MAG: transporter [Verrucomicrobia bacterium]|nr:transporter [Verrucomicrobiota bacterium]
MATRLHRSGLAVALALAVAPPLYAPPPLVTGDVPTADKETFEWYLGGRYVESESGASEWLAPFTELVYGLSDRQELTFETAGLSQDSKYGLADSVAGTKYVFVKETERWPGIGGSFELKLPTGDKDRGLGSGEFDYDVRLRAQKTWAWFTGIVNAGHTFVTEPEFGGIRQSREDTWLLTFGQEYQVARKTKLLSEIYYVTRDEPSQPNRLAGNIGFKHRLWEGFTVHAAVGTSLREEHRGGPELRVYAGFKYEFDAPWRSR